MLRSPFIRCQNYHFSSNRQQRTRSLLVEHLENRLLLATIDYATFLGGNGSDYAAKSIAVEGGCTYVAGRTRGSDSWDHTIGDGGFADVYVAKLDTDANPDDGLPCSSQTLRIGGSDHDGAADLVGMDVAPSGDVVLVGYTHGPFPGEITGADGMFITVLDGDLTSQQGAIVLPDSEGTDVAVDSEGNIYVTGWTTNQGLGFTNTPQGGGDALVAKYDQDLVFQWGTYIGGTGSDYGYSLALHESTAGVSTYVTGSTRSSNFPTSGNAVSETLSGVDDVFVARLDPDGDLDYGTYLGGNDSRKDGYERGEGITVASDGSAWVTGGITSNDYLGTSGAFQQTSNGNREVFAAKIDPDAPGPSLQYFTYVGGTGDEWAYDIAVDSDHVYITGETYSSSFPVQDPLASGQERSGKRDGFLIKLDPAADPQDQLVFSTYLGGSAEDQSRSVAVDAAGDVYLGGWTKSGNFPVTSNAFDSSLDGKRDGTVTRISFAADTPNTPPTTTGLADVVVDEDAADTVVDLFPAFDDAEDADTALTFTVVSNSNSALFSSTDVNGVTGTLTLDYAPDAHGTADLTVRATDSGGLSEETSLHVTVNSLNDAPVAGNQSVTVKANGSKSITLTASDADGDALTFTVLTNPSDGTLSGAAPNLTYTPDSNFLGSDSFTFLVNDGTADSPAATVSITVNPVLSTKFYVVDDFADGTYEYDAAATPLSDATWNLAGGNTDPRGAAADATGTTVWVVDSDKRVHVYDGDGVVQGSWAAKGGLKTPQGVASDGTDIWIVDTRGDKVRRYSGAATRTSGNQGSSSSFSLSASNPTGITTDGATIWVVDSGADRVYKYNTAGGSLGDWALNIANTNSTGLTIDPSGTNTTSIWVVDNGSDTVYEYNRGTGAFLGSFPLDALAGNTNPQGIADPPAPTRADLLEEPAVSVVALFVAERPAVDRDAAASPNRGSAPLAVPRQAPIYGPAVDSVMTGIGKPDLGDSDDKAQWSPSLEEALEQLSAAL